MTKEDFSLLFQDYEGTNEKLEKLSEIISDKILVNDKDKVHYFTLPVWDFENNSWEPDTIGRFLDPEGEGDGNWETGTEKPSQNGYKRYCKFFEEAKKECSFIDFFTNEVERLSPFFTIKYVDKDQFSLENNTLSFKLNAVKDKKEDIDEFIKVTERLLKKNDTDSLTNHKILKLTGFYKFLCTYKKHYRKLSNIYLFPSLLFKPISAQRHVSSGGCILVCKWKIDEDKLYRIAILSNLCYRELGGKNWAEISRKSAIKSAKAAIMSRNMSHNLGSHVMYYIKQRLESVDKVLETGTLMRLILATSRGEINKLNFDDKQIRKNVLKIDEEMPFLIGLGRFINYLQERQDYIATISTDFIPYKSTVNFKDAIYDELKPDLKFFRHKGEESIKGKEPQNLILDYIAYSEGFQKSDMIELWFEDFNGLDTPSDVPNSLRDLNVALPGGTLGRQAFFSIMENIIRNTAKHDKNKAQNGKLKFKFEVLEPAEINGIEGFSLRQGEGKGEMFNMSCYECSQNKFFFLGITVILEGDVSDIIIDKIKSGLQQEYLSKDGQMDENCKGLKEIRISAAWLRGEDLDNEISRKEPPAVAIRKTDEGHLQYVVCLPKPKRVAFLTGTETDSGVDKYGCQEFSLPSKDDKKGQKEIADFEMVVCSKEQRKELVFVGSRILVVEDVHDYVHKYEENGLDEIYIEWLRQEFPNHINNVKLSILDGKVSSTVEEQLLDGMKIIKGTSDDTEQSFYNNNIVFNTHYPGQALVENKELFAQAHFVESVSGANSTDRLIRYDNRDIAWYCKQMSAGLTNVAIFDERLYEHIVPQEGYRLSEIQEAVKIYFKSHTFTEDSVSEKMRFVIEMAPKFKLTDSQKKRVYDKLPNKLSEDECIKSLMCLFKNYSKTWQYREKGIWAFDILIKTQNDIEIIGYNAAPNNGPIGLFHSDYREMAIGHITSLDNKVKVRLNPSNEIFKQQFDFISIHQGLLDKVYGQLDIHDDYQKEEVTKAIFDVFSKSAGKEIVTDQESGFQETEIGNTKCKYFLPKFIIHSGRSKPNHKDMPQRLPFLQFSAIDHAVRDCKYILTELLYSAHHEQN